MSAHAYEAEGLPAILEQLGRLEAAFRQDLPDTSRSIYVEALRDQDPADVAAAVTHLIREARFMPPVADIRREALDARRLRVERARAALPREAKLSHEEATQRLLAGVPKLREWLERHPRLEPGSGSS